MMRDGLTHGLSMVVILLAGINAFSLDEECRYIRIDEQAATDRALPLVNKTERISLYAGKGMVAGESACILVMAVGGKYFEYDFDYSGYVTSFYLSDEYKTLVTLWTTGSAYRVVIFQLTEDAPVWVKTIGAKAFPSIIASGDNWVFLCPQIDTCEILILNKDGISVMDKVVSDRESVTKITAAFIDTLCQIDPVK